jgi:sterol 24-C-methyltransferase
MTDKYDSNNEAHKRIKYRIELGNGLPPMHRTTEILEVMKKMGFEILEGKLDFTKITDLIFSY